MQPRLLKHPARLAGASLLRLQEDNRLVALAREGHDPAFAAIVTRYGPPLERYCARLLGPGRAEDAVQQAFVNAHAAMRTSDDELALKPWLYRIAHNASLNILRAAKDDSDLLDEERPAPTMTTEVVELRERLRETLASIQALPAAQRDALLLREIEGRSHEEIAVALGVTEGGARQHLHRARVSLRAAASAITPYPVLARILSAAASEGGRNADLVSGAGVGAGAGAIKVTASLLAAGAIAGTAVTSQHHRARSSAAAAGSTSNRSTTAPSVANGPSAASLTVADDKPAGATPNRDRGRGGIGARGRRRGRSGGGQHGSGGAFTLGRDPSHHHSGSGEHHSSSGTSDTPGELDSSHHDGSGSSGSGSIGGSGDTTFEASHGGTSGGSDDTTSLSGGSSGPGSGTDDGASTGSSGFDGGGGTTTSTTTPTTDGSSGSGGGSGTSGASDDPTTTTDH